MTTQRLIGKHPYRWRLLPSAMLFLTLIATLVSTQPALAALVWQTQTVDSGGNVGWSTSLALDSSGNPVISYYDLTNQDLKLVHCGNAICSSGNTIRTVDSAGDVGRENSLELDSSGKPVISYYDITNGDLKLVHCGNTTCSSGNTIQTVDSAGNVGKATSLVLDSSGKPVISYYDLPIGNLKLAHCGNATCSSGNTIQTLAGTAASFVQDNALKLDSSGNPVISYYDGVNGDLKLVHCGNATCSSGNTIQTVDSAGDVGLYASLALDSSGNPVISYHDESNGSIKLAHCGNATCSSGNTIQTVDRGEYVGLDTSLVLDGSGNPVISYYDLFNGYLKLVQCGNTSCSRGNTIQIVDSAGDVGEFTSLALDSSGKPVISYYDFTNQDLKLARLVDVDTTPPTANPSQSPAAGANGWTNSDVTVTWTWQDNTGGSGIDTTRCTTSSTSTGEGVQTLTATCTDKVGNVGSASYTVKVDKTTPIVTVTGVSNNATYTLGSVPTAACSTSDALSGVATPATVSVTGGNPDGTGTFTAICSPATDLAGNSSAPTSVSYTVNALINSSVSQQSASAVYTATPQNCPSTGANLPFQTVTPTLRNISTKSFTGLFFRVKTVEYTTAQGGQQPVLCNATSGAGGVGSTLAIANGNLPGGNGQFNPGEDLLPTFQIGLPVRVAYRLFVELYAVGASAATEDATQTGEYLGSFAYTFDEREPVASETHTLFLPLINR